MNREQTRTRAGGTPVTNSDGDPALRLAALRKIVAEHQYAKIDGIMVDGFTASAIVLVHDAVSKQNQEKLLSMPIHKMANIAFQLVK